MLTLGFLFLSLVAAGPDTAADRQVRYGLLTVPYYGVFDYLSFQRDGSRVVLSGQVTKPSIRSDAERVLHTVEGVSAVENRIEVLPPSLSDDALRIAVHQALYSQPSVRRYLLQAVPSIHIVVSGGQVTLEGAVWSDADRDFTAAQVANVAGVQKITNHLRVEQPELPPLTPEEAAAIGAVRPRL